MHRSWGLRLEYSGHHIRKKKSGELTCLKKKKLKKEKKKKKEVLFTVAHFSQLPVSFQTENRLNVQDVQQQIHQTFCMNSGRTH